MSKAAVLIPSNERLNMDGRQRTRVGGADMRFMSLHHALDATHGCLLVEVACERSTICRDACRATGVPRSAPVPWFFDRPYCPENADRIADELISSGVSVVVCSSLNVYRYVVHLAARPELTVIFDMHNVESVLYRDMRAAIPPCSPYHAVLTAENVSKMAAAERAAVEAADEVWVCSRDDQVLARAEYGIAADKMIRLVSDVVEVPASAPDGGPPSKAVFTARLDYYPNILAAEVLIRDIGPALAPVPVVIAGAQPDAALLALRRPDNVEIVADPESMEDIRRGGIMTVPLRYGGGSRFKIIEAFAAGLPVVSTRKGAEGLAAEADVHYLVAETPEEFAAAVRKLRADDALRERMVRASWKLAVEYHSQAALTAQLARLEHFDS